MDLRIEPDDLSRARRPGGVGVTLGASFAGRTWEIKVGIGRSKARDQDGLGHLPSGQQARATFPDDGRTGLTREPSSWYPEYGPRPPSIGQPPNPETQRVSAHENETMVNFWSSLNADQKRAFTAMAHERVFASGAQLMQEGEQADHVAVIRSGQTEIRVCENGAERVLAVRGPGQLIGERAALEISVRSATVVAIQPVEALVMRTEEFAAFISTYPAVLKIVENQIYVRLREGTARYEPDMSQDPADGWTVPNRSDSRYAESAARRPPLLAGENCTVVRTDVVEFGADRRNAEDQRILKQANVAMTQLALGPAWDTCRREGRGDGELIVVSPGIPTAQVIDRLLTVLPHELKRHNHIYSDPIRMKLRVAVEVGPIEEDSLGVSGKSIIRVSRMLDAPAFKQAIADRGAILGLIVSPFVYETYIVPGRDSLDPANYAQVPVRVKETCISAWTQLIDPAGAVLPPRELLIRLGGHRGDGLAAA